MQVLSLYPFMQALLFITVHIFFTVAPFSLFTFVIVGKKSRVPFLVERMD